MTETGFTPVMIKRYANRKLYNTEESKYINLSDIAQMVQAGVPVQIVDNNTGEDVTRRMLAQMMVETEKKQRRKPSDFFQRVINVGAEPLHDVVNRLPLDQGKELVDSLRTDVEKEVQRWVKRGEVTKEEIRHFFDHWQKNIDDISTTTETTVTGWFDRVLNRVQSNEILRRLDELEKRIAELEKR